MGETNTPPVSPQDQSSCESDEEGIGTQGESGDDFEVIEVYDIEDINDDDVAEDAAEGKHLEEGEEDEEEMSDVDVPDDAVMAFKQHAGWFIVTTIFYENTVSLQFFKF